MWDINLDDLPVKQIPEESLVKLRNNETFTASVDGKTIEFRLTTGDDERRGTKFLRGMNQQILELLNLRILAVEGVERKDKKKWLSDLDLSAHRDLLAAFDEHDGGVETEIEVECQECGQVFPVELPFGREFFLPVRRRKDSSNTTQR